MIIIINCATIQIIINSKVSVKLPSNRYIDRSDIIKNQQIKFRVIPNDDDINKVTKTNVGLMYEVHIDNYGIKIDFELIVTANIYVKKKYIYDLYESNISKINLLAFDMFILVYDYLRNNVGATMNNFGIISNPLPVLNVYEDGLMLSDNSDNLRKIIKSSRLFVDFNN